MSTETFNPPAETNGHHHKLPGVRTYRGRNLEELIPQIRNELGPDALIVRQREGLTGGVGGFFAQRCVEVEAQAMKRIDVYDDEPESAPADQTPANETPADQTPARDVPAKEAPAGEVPPEIDMPAPVADLSSAYQAFAARLEQAAAHVEDVDELMEAAAVELPPEPVGELPPEPALELPPEPAAASEPEPEPEPEPVAAVEPEPEPVATPPVISPAQRAWAAKQVANVDPAEAAAVTGELTAQGISQAWAEELIVAAAAHRLPLMPGGDLRDAVRATLAATIPAPAPLPTSGAAVAFVGAGGAGKTRCAAALAAAYSRAGTLAAAVVSVGVPDWGGELKELLKTQSVWVTAAARGIDAHATVAATREGGLVVIDTVPATPGDTTSVQALAAELEPLVPDAVYIAVPATFSVHAAQKLLESFEPLGADGIAVTHADEADQLGVAAELAYVSGMPIAYIHEGVELDRALSAADPSSLAKRLLP